MHERGSTTTDARGSPRANLPAVIGCLLAAGIALSSLPAAPPAMPEGPNLIRNSTFEEDAPGSIPAGYATWQAEGGKGSLGVDATAGYRSRCAARVTGAANACYQYTIDVKPGETYAAASLCRQKGKGTPVMAIYWKDAQHRWNWPAGITRAAYRPYDGEWRQAVARVQVPPEGVAQLTVLLAVEGQTSDEDSVWFDDVRLVKTTPAAAAAAPRREMKTHVVPLLDPASLRDGDAAAPSQMEVCRTLRMGVYMYGAVTRADAEKDLTRLRDAGYNAILTEGQRYLFVDSPEHPPLPDVLSGSLPFAENVRHTRTVVEVCHSLGLKAYLHLTMAAGPDALAAEHPDWMALSLKDGAPTPIWGLRWACPNNEEFLRAYYSRLETLVRESGADGLMVDETTLMYDFCGCAWCRRRFAADTGLELPAAGAAWLEDLSSPLRRAFLAWRLGCAVKTNHTIRQILRRHCPDGLMLSYYALPCLPTCWYNHGCSIDALGEFADVVGWEVQTTPRILEHWPVMVAALKVVRAVAEGGAGSIFAIAGGQDYPSSYYYWMILLSQGAHQYWTNFVTPQQDAERTPCVRWEKAHERFLAGLRSIPDLAVWFSTRSNNLVDRPAGGINRQNSYLAVCSALSLAGMPYKVLVDKDLRSGSLGEKARTIVMLNVGAVSDAEAAVLTRFVEAGGNLIASAEASLYDENGGRRPNFALNTLFGCDYRGTVPEGGTLLLADSGALGAGPVELRHPDESCIVAPRPSAIVLAHQQNAGGRRFPALLLNRVGMGTVVYFAGHPETSFYLTEWNGNQVQPRDPWSAPRDPDMARFFCGVVAHLARNRITVSNLPEGVLVEAYDHEYAGARGIQVHLANLTGGALAGAPDGAVPFNRQITFPDLRPLLPEPGRPIRIRLKRSDIRDAFCLTPDAVGLFEVPLVKAGDETFCEVPAFGRYLIVYLNQGETEAVRRLARVPLRPGPPEFEPIELQEAAP